jgi:hypothetical protein
MPPAAWARRFGRVSRRCPNLGKHGDIVPIIPMSAMLLHDLTQYIVGLIISRSFSGVGHLAMYLDEKDSSGEEIGS